MSELAPPERQARSGPHLPPPSETDRADLVEHAPVLARFLADLAELIDQIAVAGLAYPDADLPDSLAMVQERAARLGLARAELGLEQLRAAVTAVRDAARPGQAAPAELTRAAWDATQRLVAWLRLFERAFALQQVEARLAGQALVAQGAREARPQTPTASMQVWPLGCVIRDDRVTITGLDLATGQRVTVKDRISDFPPDAPMSRPVISRLFQAVVSLPKVLGGLIAFDDHPVGRSRGGPLFGPAFRAVPRALEIADERPVALRPLPVATPSDLEHLRRPMQATLTVERALDGVRFWLGPTEADLERTESLELAGLKLLLRSQTRSTAVGAIIGPSAGAPRVLSAEDPEGGRVYPAHDPGAFPLAPATLFQRARAASAAIDGGTHGRWLESTAALYGGAGDAARRALHQSWLGPQPSLEGHYRAAIMRLLHGGSAELDALDHATALVDATLLLGALPEADVHPSDLTPLLGRTALRGEHLGGRHLFQAVWLTMELDLVDDRQAALLTLYAARYAEPMSAPDPWHIACRTLLLAELALGAAEGEVEAGEEPLSVDEILGPPRDYLEAHLDDLRPKAGRGADEPLPGCAALYALADTRARLWDTPRRQGLLEPVGVPRLRLARAVIEALLDLDRRSADAADALLIARLAGIGGWCIA